MKKKIIEKELDLIEILLIIWSGKFKIASITIIFLLISISIYFITKPEIKARTELYPINIFQENSYSAFNLSINEIKNNEQKNENINQGTYLTKYNKNNLFNLFLEEIRTKKILFEGIKRFNLIDNKFNDEDKYFDAIERESLKLKLLPPKNVDGAKSGEVRPYWTINFKVNDTEKWELVLNYINNEINKKIKNYLIFNFKSSFENLNLLKKFKIEDLENKIINTKLDYEREVSNRLAFLNEQSLIARSLNIKMNTLEAQNYNAPSAIISNIQTKNPYYMRGYVMIEKEIELINSRTNKEAFTKNLFDLEKQKRDLIEDKSLERLKFLFSQTPIMNSENFIAANIIHKDTKYEPSYSLKMLIMLTTILGIMVGTFYVLLIHNLKNKLK